VTLEARSQAYALVGLCSLLAKQDSAGTPSLGYGRTSKLAARLSPLRSQVTQKDNLYITIDEGIDKEQLRRAVASDTPDGELTRLVSTVSGALNSNACFPSR
jgi:hypothetical protein